MPYNSETSAYERRAATVIDATPDGDTVAIAIDVKLDQGIDDYVADLNHHKTNGNHYPATSVADDGRYFYQSPAGETSWKVGIPAPDAALKDFSNVASGAIAPSKITQDASNRFVTDTEKATWNGALYDKADVEGVLTGEITSHTHMVGELVWATGAAPLPGTIAANGATLSRTAYSRLWAYAQASGNISVDDASWTEGQYSPGDGATTFRVPKVDDRFIRGKSSTRAVGLVEEDEFKIHTHLLYAKGYTYGTLQSGAGQGLDGTVASYAIATGGYNANTGGDETRPKALTMLPCIVY